MSDSNKFVNAYIDTAVSQLHESINTILQLKAQLRVANELVTEKDAVINKLMQDLESNKADNQEIVKYRDQARKWEDAHNAMSGKVAHLDTALSQIAQMKKEVIVRDEKITQLQEQIKVLKNPTSKKAINTRVKKEIVKEENFSSDMIEKQPIDDF